MRVTWILCAVLGVAGAACARRTERTLLTVYSPHGKELLSYYESGFEKANPDIDVRWVDMGSAEILERLRAEKEMPVADVWFGAPAELMVRAAKENLLDTITPSWAGALPPSARDASHHWYGTYITPAVIAYHTRFVADSVAPHDWADVANVRWKDHVVLRDPVASGTMRSIFGAMLERSIMQTGKTDSAWSWLRRLDGNTREYTTTPAVLYEKLLRGEGWISLYDMPDIAALARRSNAQIKFVYPTSGTPLAIDAIALVRGGAHRVEAVKYLEYVTTVAALRFAADSFYRIPARADIPDAKLPAWMLEARKNIVPLAVDGALMADSLDRWMRAWDATVRNRNQKK